MNKVINVNLAFHADTNAVKQQLRSVQTELSQLANSSSLGEHLTAEMQQGIRAAGELKAALTTATSVDTGKLNLSTFNANLQRSGVTLKEFGARLSTLGPQGQIGRAHV